MPFLLQTSDTSSILPQIFREDVEESIIGLFKENIWLLVLLIVAVTIIIIFLYSLITKLLNFLYSKIFKNSEYIEFGKLKIKNNLYRTKKNTADNSRMIDINSFVNMLDILLSNTIDNIIAKTMETTNSINNIEKEYINSCNNIFSAVYTDIGNDYYRGLINYACKKINMDLTKIHNTREYFFISDLVHDTRTTWLELSEEIVNRNGFVEILSDISKADQYIEELNGCIFRTTDMHKLESTELDKVEIDEILNNVNKKFKEKMENMFKRLGNLKVMMLEKKRIKMEYIDTNIKTSVNDVIKEVEQKFLDDNIPQIDNKNNNNTNDKNSSKQ